ncbi:hypothetical protein C0J52_24762 [Blattella germanica]|nr:hypothetical protein C0J52_24762 [Blattella germanica]
MDIFHHHLQARCLESLGTYLTEQLMILMYTSEDHFLSDSRFRQQFLLPFCRHLETNILNTVRFYPSVAIVKK